MKRGKLIVISAPSGCGKTTIAHEILKQHPSTEFSVSATTRKKRNGEIDGKDYYFLTKEEFDKRIRNGELVEYEEIYGNYYGTLKSVVEKALRGGRVILFDIDVNGGLTIKKKYPDDAVLIFIKPPSMEVLKQRLMNRHTEDAETVQKRLERVPMELEKGKAYDYSVVNDDLQKTVQEVEAIVKKVLQD